jgi:hypothetical protein
MGGMGQVGSALVKILRRKFSVEVLDIGNKPEKSCDFLHVSIPYGERFISSVQDAKIEYSPKWVIIHSTVPVGTTRSIGCNTAHSPVRGQHDDLEKSMKEFVKYVGCPDKISEQAIKGHLKTAGFYVESMESPEASELAKLLCLSRYLNDLAFYEVSEYLCKRYGVSKKLVNDWTRTYNLGYRGTKWVRPLLDFPSGKVGGHCVMPVSRMLADQTGDKWLEKNISVFGG